MTFVAALPKGIEETEKEGTLFTCVVPSINGCNLKCKFCFIRDRNEIQPGKEYLSVDNYVQFIKSFHEINPISMISIQGHEPLLKESWPYTEAILQEAKKLNIPSALVTNGTFLETNIDGLNRLDLKGIVISLDSGDKKYHDRIRGVLGAFDSAARGLKKASLVPGLSSKLVVSSILMPDNIEHLKTMPSLLEKLGVRRWVITSVVDIKQFREEAWEDEGPGNFQSVFEDIKKNSAERGINLIFDDTFKKVGSPGYKTSREIADRLDGIWRLTPNGYCSISTSILDKVNRYTPCWNPTVETANTFISRLLLEADG